MKMKSLLLGAAAAIATAGAASAADLPMTKAEPVEYVKVCSEFGAGFFYIPGSDTCLKIGGNVRADYTVGSANDDDAHYNGTINGISRSVDQTSFQGRAQIQFDARTQTDFGLLRSFVSLNAKTGNSNNQTWAFGSVSGSGMSVDKAFIQFGGLTAGYAESQFAYFDNYFGDAFFAPYYGSGGVGTKQQLAYTFQFGGGFSGTLSLEDPKGNSLGVDTPWDDGVALAGTQSPDIVANLYVEQGWGSAQIMAAAHQVRTLGFSAPGINGVGIVSSGKDDWGFAVGAGASLKFPAMAGGFIAIEGVYADGASAYAGVSNNQYSPAGAPYTFDAYVDNNGSLKTAKSWALNGEAGINFTPQWRGMLFGSYGEYEVPTLYAGMRDYGFKTFVAGAQLRYEVVKNFTIGGEVYYAGTDSDKNCVDGTCSWLANYSNGVELNKANTGAWVGGIRIRRDF